jgi:aryl-alcohol dehydrogenase-like predicted oxidoreductase
MIKSGVFEAAQIVDKLCFVRSIYLQGLLLMSPDDVKRKLPAAYQASRKWCSIASRLGLSRAELAAKFAKSLGQPLVVGMDNADHVENNISLYSARALGLKMANELHEELAPFLSDEIINPSKWAIPK